MNGVVLLRLVDGQLDRLAAERETPVIDAIARFALPKTDSSTYGIPYFAQIFFTRG